MKKQRAFHQNLCATATPGKLHEHGHAQYVLIMVHHYVQLNSYKSPNQESGLSVQQWKGSLEGHLRGHFIMFYLP